MPYQRQFAMSAAEREALKQREAQFRSTQNMNLLQGLLINPATMVLGRALQQWETPGQEASRLATEQEIRGAEFWLDQQMKAARAEEKWRKAEGPLAMLPDGSVAIRGKFADAQPYAGELRGVGGAAPAAPALGTIGAAPAAPALGTVGAQPPALTTPNVLNRALTGPVVPRALRGGPYDPGEYQAPPAMQDVPAYRPMPTTPLNERVDRPLRRTTGVLSEQQQLELLQKSMGEAAAREKAQTEGRRVTRVLSNEEAEAYQRTKVIADAMGERYDAKYKKIASGIVMANQQKMAAHLDILKIQAGLVKAGMQADATTRAASIRATAAKATNLAAKAYETQEKSLIAAIQAATGGKTVDELGDKFLGIAPALDVAVAANQDALRDIANVTSINIYQPAQGDETPEQTIQRLRGIVQLAVTPKKGEKPPSNTGEFFRGKRDGYLATTDIIGRATEKGEWNGKASADVAVAALNAAIAVAQSEIAAAAARGDRGLAIALGSKISQLDHTMNQIRENPNQNWADQVHTAFIRQLLDFQSLDK